MSSRWALGFLLVASPAFAETEARLCETVKSSETMPAGRYGHEIFLAWKARHLYALFGTFKDDAWQFDLNSKRWSEACRVVVPFRKRLATALDGSTLTLYVVEKSTSGGAIALWSENLKSGLSRKVNLSAPTDFDDYAIPYSTGGDFLVFHRYASETSAKTWVLNLSSAVLREAQGEPGPTVNPGAARVIVGNSLFFIGGISQDVPEYGQNASGDFWELNLESAKWIQHPSASPRFDHAAVFVQSSSQIFIAGGLSGSWDLMGSYRRDDTKEASDARSYSIPSRKWVEEGRIEANHSSVFGLQDNPRLVYRPQQDALLLFYAVNFGEIQRYDLAKKSWEVVFSSLRPDFRDQYQVAVDNGNGDVYLFGGDDYRVQPKAKVFNDIWRFDASQNKWERIF